MKPAFLLCVVVLFFSCAEEDYIKFDPEAERTPNLNINASSFADVNLGAETRSLFSKLETVTQKGIALGQQDPFGTGSAFGPSNALPRDFSDLTGDHPAVVGFDLEFITTQSRVVRSDGSSRLRNFIDTFSSRVREAHNNGSIITISWHIVSPTSFLFDGDDIYEGAVAGMLEGGEFRDHFLEALEVASLLFKALVDDNGNPIPVLFRPWHEMNGDFFFWGEPFRTTEAYVQLWRDTVDVLSNDLDVHNLLYVYAPNWLSDRSEYLRNYPGDAYVDVLGIDVYDFRNRRFVERALTNLKIVEDIAREKNKLFALTETGLENVTQDDWWTQSLYRAIRSSGITYAMLWRNDTDAFFHIPFLGHSSEDDFRAFITEDKILLSSDIE